MAHDWIIKVLADLRDYAQMNDLAALAEQIEETLRVAEAEATAPRRLPEPLRPRQAMR